MACAAAVLVGCATNHDDGRGTAPGDYGTYRGTRDDALLEGPNRGVNTNYFGPVNAGPEAARGPGTPSGHYGY